MYCTNCGKEVTGNFCANCGTPVNPENIPQEVADAESVQTDEIVTNDKFTEKKNKVMDIISGIFNKIKESKFITEKKYKKKRFIILAVIVVLFLAFNIFGGDSSDDSYSGSSGSSSYSAIETSSDAISKAKNTYNLDQRIAGALGFKQFYQPDFGTSSAKEVNGTWKVTLKGKMSGYIDDYQSDFETYKFEAVVTVSSGGTGVVTSVRKAY